MKTLTILMFVFVAAGCSSREIYEEAQNDRRIECLHGPPTEYERCMMRAEKSFDEYQREREEIVR